jgi:hypothetical protein
LDDPTESPPSPLPPPAFDVAPPGPAQLDVPPPAPAPEPPPAPRWSRAYEQPSTRNVVGSGFQLLLDAAGAIRRASIYIGLLALGAFGPTVLLMLLAIGRLLGDSSLLDRITVDPTGVLMERPELLNPFLLIEGLLVVGIFLLLAISIDAQAIAISILGGQAGDRPLRLGEAVTRARQVFWRLAGAGLLVGVASGAVALVVAAPFLRPFDTNWGIRFIGSMAGALVVTPFAFASTGIVLGDVDALEALRRSYGLFRLRPQIALVVTMFTLVTAAIQSFALGASLDVVVRAGELLHLDVTRGGIDLAITAAIVLACIVAFGSLTFTIASIVAAPQVAAFLGLTYYSAGLDRARSADGAQTSGFRWVSIPMLLAMLAIAVLAISNVPSIASI